MDGILLQTLTGLGGVIIGILGTFLVTMYTSRQDIKKAKLVYEQQLQVNERSYRQKLDETYTANARLQIDTVYIPLNISLTKLMDAYDTFGLMWEIYDEIHEEDEEEMWKACSTFIAEISELFAQGKDVFLTAELEHSLRSFKSFIYSELLDHQRYKVPLESTKMGERLLAETGKLKLLIREVTLGTNPTLIQNSTADPKKRETKKQDEKLAEVVTLSNIPDF